MHITALCTVVATMMTLAAAMAAPAHPDDTIRAVRINEFGPPEVLRIERVNRPTPGKGELLVRVHAAAVNPIDTIIRTNGACGIADARLPYTPGFDLSGEADGIAPFRTVRCGGGAQAERDPTDSRQDRTSHHRVIGDRARDSLLSA